jgi:hypothetical protein
VIGLATLPFLSSAPMPAFKELSMLIHLKAVPGTSQPEMSRISGRMGNELRKTDGVRNVGTHIDRAVLGDQIVDVNSAELWVSIEPNANYNKTAKAIKNVVEGYPGLSYTVQTYLRTKSGDVIQNEDSVVVRVLATITTSSVQPRRRKKRLPDPGNCRAKLKLYSRGNARNRSRPGRRTKARPQTGRRAAAAACLLSGIQVGALRGSTSFRRGRVEHAETRHSISSIADL